MNYFENKGTNLCISAEGLFSGQLKSHYVIWQVAQVADAIFKHL